MLPAAQHTDQDSFYYASLRGFQKSGQQVAIGGRIGLCQLLRSQYCPAKILGT